MYENNYSQYFQDQLLRFESFEGDLYADGIRKTIEYIFPEKNYNYLALDFCCGDGSSAVLLEEKGMFVCAFDGNPRKIERAEARDSGVEWWVSDASDIMEDIDPLIRFDLIYASHCMEHLLDPIAALEDCKRLLAPDGQIILILPYPNEECEGHPGSNILKLNGGLFEVEENLMNLGFDVDIERVNIRESELVIKLRNLHA